MSGPAEARRAIAGENWWHTIEVAPGVVTPGGWDLRPTAERVPWPAPLTGLRCLDVGTMDGFWAFELERRGAKEVIALDMVDPARRTFAIAADLLGSRVVYRARNVHDLDPAEDGEFDLVFVGYVLQLVRDPLGALERLRSVYRGSLIVLDTVSLPLSLLPAPLARLDARRDGSEFFVFNRRGWRKALELAGFVVEAETRIIRDHAGPAVGPTSLALLPRLWHATGIRGRSIAVRARPTSAGEPARRGPDTARRTRPRRARALR